MKTFKQIKYCIKKTTILVLIFLTITTVHAQTTFRIEAENYINYIDTTPQNIGGKLHQDGVDIEVTLDSGGGYNVGWIETNEQLEYEFNIPSGEYTLSSRVASNIGGGRYSVSLDGILINFDNVTDTTGWQKFVTKAIGNVTVGEGNHKLLVEVSSGGFNLNWLSLTSVASNFKFEAEDFERAIDSDTINHGAAYRLNDEVDIQTTTDSGGGFNIGWTRKNEWLEYNISVEQSAEFILDARVASLNGSGVFTVEIDGDDRGVFNVDSTGGWQNWITLPINIGFLSQGEHTLRVVFHAGGINLNWFNLKLNTDSSGSSGELRPDSPWTYLIVPPEKSYGKRKFSVPAAQNWINTGLYLEAGQQASISASGKWKLNGADFYNADGHPTKTKRGCAVGELVARIGLSMNDSLICIGLNGTLTASKAGIIYLGGNLTTDQSEGFDKRYESGAEGELLVTVVANDGSTVPTISANQVTSYPFASIQSGWVEILGKHTIFTLPTNVAEQDAADIPAAIARIDAMYELHTDIRGKMPFFGQPIRWYVDATASGAMYAGNPIRIQPGYILGSSNRRITQAAKVGNDNWGFAHELGHTFGYINEVWVYSTLLQFEAWPNIFTMHVMEGLNIPKNLSCATRKADYLAGGIFNPPVKKDTKLALCFFMEFKERYGWDFYRNFYAGLNASEFRGWKALRTRFSNAAGEDVNYIFNEWKLPQR